ncbi:MAG: hypothetical protein JAZ15_15735, partial [Candidatus Thiodiazotropha endolucinida]|nr:hypothetical protein [Candidatus Thiodiazotropha taylori]MCW4314470.1 hypothetical protein [Candidatus Thiodiazotropha taylori]
LAEWSVAKSAGGKESFADGWILRGKIAGARGNFKAADDFFVKALKFAENRSPVFYELGKLREIRGFLFSREGAEIESEEEAISFLNKATETFPSIGAYDFYKLSLIYYNKLTDTIGPSSDKEVGVLDYLESYDSHYAVARLAYLRHTTGALQESAHHFRICRRLASLKALTTPVIRESYAFDYLLLESFKSQANPFHTTKLDSSEVIQEQSPFIGIRNLNIAAEVKLSFVGPTFVDPIVNSGYVRKYVANNVNWLAVNTHQISHKLDQLDPSTNRSFQDVVLEVDKYLVTEGTGFDETSFHALLDGEGIGGYIKSTIDGFLNLISGQKEPISSRLNISPSLIHFLQNPQLLLPGLI